MSLVTRPGGAEQHNTTTAEIARNADQATQGMTLNIGSMSRAAADTGHSSKDVLRAGVELTRQGEAPQPHDVIQVSGSELRSKTSTLGMRKSEKALAGRCRKEQSGSLPEP